MTMDQWAHIFEVLVDVGLDPVMNQQVPLAVEWREGKTGPPVLAQGGGHGHYEHRVNLLEQGPERHTHQVELPVSKSQHFWEQVAPGVQEEVSCHEL